VTTPGTMSVASRTTAGTAAPALAARAGQPADAGAPVLTVRGLRHRYAGAEHESLAGIDLDVFPGEVLALVGPSGCGKSTLLSILAGLDRPTAGEITSTAAATALMFQDASLFPWLTVEGNLDLALKLRGVPRARRPAQVAELLGLVRLAGRGAARPHELSGGMRQRVALARAFAQEADLVLMDEPFGALDAVTRAGMHVELDRLRAERPFTVVLVTHDVHEAAALADRVLVLGVPGHIIADVTVDLPRPRTAAADVDALARRLGALLPAHEQ
jgi:NitT/TauT family transport system ATP-binding protein